jgi:hypothetical protein
VSACTLDWQHTIKSLENGSPATVADLHALLIDHLHDVRQQIERDNADIFTILASADPPAVGLTIFARGASALVDGEEEHERETAKLYTKIV